MVIHLRFSGHSWRSLLKTLTLTELTTSYGLGIAQPNFEPCKCSRFAQTKTLEATPLHV